MGDDTITNFNVPSFSVAGVSYSRIGLGSNGYLVLGGGTQADVSINNQDLPNPARPNNLLVGFWSDLNPSAAGALRIATLTDGADTWLVVDYAGVPEFSTATTSHTFEFWIGLNTDAHPAEDVSLAFGTGNVGTGDIGFATAAGAENPDGTSGNALYVNGAGTLPADNAEYTVTGTPGQTFSATVSFAARARSAGAYVNYAEVTGDVFDGTAIARFAGTVTP